MNILHIIGNGLDIAHHLKTSYQDFFKYYLGIPTDDADIAKMKRDIDKFRYETWADLEIGLGQYSAKCASKEVFLKCVADMKAHLKIYLEREAEKIKLIEPESLDGLFQFGNLFEPEPRTRYQAYVNSFNSQTKQLDVITFNYTPTLESMTKYDGSPMYINRTSNVILNSAYHIHGMLNNMMVMGVNDSTQIANESFNSDRDVEEEFIKPMYNDACMNNKNANCKRLIESANIIVIYGSSLGESDNQWWHLIGKRLSATTSPMLLYLPYDKDKDLTSAPNRLLRWTQSYVSEIKTKFRITIAEDILFRRVCVAINKQLIPETKVPLKL